MVPGVGLELPLHGDMLGLPALGDDSTFRFSVNPPFFLFGKFSRLIAGLAGCEIDDKKMPYLRWVHVRQSLDRYPKTKAKMHKMRQHKKMERWNTRQHLRGNSALSMSKLRLSIFRNVKNILKTHFSFVPKVARRFFS